jgi:RNA polymerase sigma-70 factor (ECF subfamily)
MGERPSSSAVSEGPASGATTLAERSQALRGALKRYFARQVRDAAEVDDLVQEVFLRIVRRGDPAGIERLDGYIFETAASVLKDRHRRRRTHLADRHLPFESELHADVVAGPDRDIIGRQALKAAAVALMELPQRTRQVFVLRRLEGLPYGEIARRLGLSVSAVEKHMVRAMRHLIARTGETR